MYKQMGLCCELLLGLGLIWIQFNMLQQNDKSFSIYFGALVKPMHHTVYTGSTASQVRTY